MRKHNLIARLKFLLGLALGMLLLFWCVRDLNWGGVGVAARQFSFSSILLALVLLWCSVPLRALQWWGAFPGGARPGLGPVFRATCAGYWAALVMPFRAGEPFKAVLLMRWGGVGLRHAAVSMLLCRVYDLLPIGTLVLFAVWRFRWEGVIAHDVSEYTEPIYLGVLLLLLPGLLLLLPPLRAGVWARAFAGDASPGARVARQLVALWAALPAPRDLVLGQLLGVICWGLFVLSNVPLLWAIGFDSPATALGASLVVTAWTTAAAVLPAAPAGVGTVHAACVAALLSIAPELSMETALAYAVVQHAVGSVGLAVPGLLMTPRISKTPQASSPAAEAAIPK